ncbi:hypothetical protein [Paracoccus sp. T5]|uniref:hypothetical protein n=1 Tax=Paracoccus sp. T5 TaxID=3402161 RepID=UPI003AE8A8E3
MIDGFTGTTVLPKRKVRKNWRLLKWLWKLREKTMSLALFAHSSPVNLPSRTFRRWLATTFEPGEAAG